MTRDGLEDLLRDADATAHGPVADDRDLARDARTILRRKRRARRRFATVSFLLVGTAGLWWGRPFSAVKPEQGDRLAQQAPADTSIDAIRRRALDLEADAAMRLAARLMEGQGRRARLAAYRRQASRPDPIRRVRLEAETTARLMVYQADQLRRHSATIASAERAYRRTVELFPNTHWAGVARERLRETEPENRQKPKATRENTHDAQDNHRGRRMADAAFESGGRRT